jgi:arabinose-5-phosphate isomerase
MAQPSKERLRVNDAIDHVGDDDDADDIEVGRRVLRIEAAGLEALADVLDGSFVGALEILAGVEDHGRVIVTGMGKSGHIARKIASTLASTGTPALYVHPAEASHGDLGMVTKADAVLALSNSGETPELSDIVAYCKRHKIPLVAMTGRRASALDRAADASLIIPDSAEACPMNLAPTTSTTVMIALGDALAVALLERVGFTSEDFQQRHPGGQLGRRFIKVSDIMHAGADAPLVSADTLMAETLIEMTRKSFGCVGLTDGGGRLIGIITDGDLRRNMDGELVRRRAREVMTADPRTIEPDILAAEALGVRNERAITSLFVVANDQPVGIVHIHDCLRAGLTLPMAIGRTTGPAIDKTAIGSSMATLSRQSGLRRIGGNYSRFVGLMKLVLPAVAGVLILMVIVWPQFEDKPDGFRLRPSSISLESAGGQKLVNARYTGTDRRDNPFTITAKALAQRNKDDEAVELHGVAVTAPIGSYRKKERILKLSGGVDLFHDDGYEFHTEVATVDLVDGVASSDRPVRGHGPFGRLRSSGFRILDGGERILFQGKTRLLLHPAAAEAKP